MSADKCSECGSPLMPEDEFCKGCDDALLIPLVPDIPDDLTEPDSDSLPVIEELSQADENEAHLNKGFNKRRLVAVASIFIGILVIGALFSFTDIFGSNDASDSPDEDAGIQDYSNRFTIDRAIIDGFIFDGLILENPEGIIVVTSGETIPNNHETNSINLLELHNVLNTYFEEEGLQNIFAFFDERGLVIYIQTSEIFANGSNVINEESMIILEYIRTQLSYYSIEHITIQHHTDVLKLLTGIYGFSADIYSILLEYFNGGTTGVDLFYRGTSSPIATNSTEEGRLLNNRIEIIIEYSNDSKFLEMYSTNPYDSVPGFNTQLKNVTDSLIGFWQTEWVDINGDEFFWEIEFYDNFEFLMRHNIKDSETEEAFSGRYGLDALSDRLRLHGHDFLEHAVFLFFRDNLILIFEGGEPIVLSKA